MTEPAACQAGYYAPQKATECTRCPAGSWSAAKSAECTRCPAGTELPQEGATSADACQPCRAGWYGPNAGAASCTICPAGAYCAGTGAVGWTICPFGESWGLKTWVVCTGFPLGLERG